MEMSFETARAIVDEMFRKPTQYLDDPLDAENRTKGKADPTRKVANRIIFEFIGGEPFLRTKLIDKITDYIKYRVLTEPRDYYFMLNFSTNGVNYLADDVARYVSKNKQLLSIGITIDGTEPMHDSCRVFPDGTGSYKHVIKSARQWLVDFSAIRRVSTKVTISPENVGYLSEAIIHLWSIVGIQNVAANVVFEPVWKDEHASVFRSELNKLRAFLLRDKNYLKYYTTLFQEDIGRALDKNDLDNTCGGNGSMLLWMYDGSFYNCIRYAPHSCKNRQGLRLGSLEEGWNPKTYSHLAGLNRRTCSDDECFFCEVASGCSYCPGAQFDRFGDPYRRAKSICDMHKVRVEVSREYFRDILADSASGENGGQVIPIDDIDRPAIDTFQNLLNKKMQILSFYPIAGAFPDVSLASLERKLGGVLVQLDETLNGMIRKYVPKKGGYYLDAGRSCFVSQTV